MRYRELLPVLLFAMIGGTAQAADNSKLISALIDTARKGATPQVQAEALDEIGQLGKAKLLGTQAPMAATQLGKLLTDLSSHPDPVPPQWQFLELHAVQALGQIGSAASGALPDLAKAVQSDLTLNAAINTAVGLIAVKATAVVSSTDTTPNAPTVDGFRIDLLDKTTPRVRLAAVKGLRDLKELAIPALADITDLMKSDSDADVRRVAAEAATDLIALLAKKADAQTTAAANGTDDAKTAAAAATAAVGAWNNVYAANLAYMAAVIPKPTLPNHDVQERLFAVEALLALTKGSDDAANTAKGTLQVLMNTPSEDPGIVAIATQAFPPKQK